MDVRVGNGLQRFVKGEIELFGLPLKNPERNKPSSALDPKDSYSFCSFCVYLAVNSFNIAVTAFGDAVTEGYSERGFDGIAISVNDIPLDSPETAEAVTRDAINTYLDSVNEMEPLDPPVVRILMVQVKMTGNAKTTELDSLGGSAYRFLTRENYLDEMKPNEMVTRWWKIFDAIRRVFRDGDVPFAPELDLLFVYQGYKSKEEHLNSNACISQRDILSEKLKHEKVNFSTWRVDEIIDAISLADKSVDGNLAGAKLLPLPDSKAFGYIGYAPARSISDMIPKIKILGDKQDYPDERVFADNVRSFTGDHKNPGAMALRKTLTDGEADQVILRHNGITIVARDATVTGDIVDGEVDVALQAYQIVNGAQSAFVLQRNCELLDDAYIPIKIVVTEDEEIKDGVVLGANLQSQISEYDMLARRKEIRSFQQAFQSVDHDRPDKLWFQRRRGERFPNRVHHPFQILTPRQIMEAYVSAIEGMPHAVHASSSKIIKRVPGSVFNIEHHPSVYRAMGWLVVAGRHWAMAAEHGWAVEGSPGTLSMNKGKNLYIPRHHFIYALWQLVDPKPTDLDVMQGKLARNSPKVEQRFENVCQILSDQNKAIELGNRAAAAVEKARESKAPIGGQVRKRSFTNRLQQTVKTV